MDFQRKTFANTFALGMYENLSHESATFAVGRPPHCVSGQGRSPLKLADCEAIVRLRSRRSKPIY